MHLNTKLIAAVAAVSIVAGCGATRGSLGPVRVADKDPVVQEQSAASDLVGTPERRVGDGTTIWDIFRNKNAEAKVQVNRYLWSASLDVLSFMPVQSIDPFTGVIVFGYGTPPGGGRSYRATVLIDDPALDARSLNVALSSRGGPVAAGTQRAIENAILDRARQLRIADSRF